MTDICCIGHITLDKIITPQHISYMPGGTAYYFSRGMASLHALTGYKLITALGSKEYPVVDELRKAGIDIDVLPSRHTVYFENRYGENSDNRTQRVLAKADPFTIDALHKENARFFHLAVYWPTTSRQKSSSTYREKPFSRSTHKVICEK